MPELYAIVCEMCCLFGLTVPCVFADYLKHKRKSSEIARPTIL